MSDPSTRTRFRIGQVWSFKTDLDYVEHSLQITEVEEHPKQGIYCRVSINYDPPYEQRLGNSLSIVGNVCLAIANDALERSVMEMLSAREPLPHLIPQEFRIPREAWTTEALPAREQTVDEQLKARGRPGMQREVAGDEDPRQLAMNEAIEGDDLAAASELLLAHREFYDQQACPLPLPYAAWQCRREIAKHFIAQGCPVNSRDDELKTPLHYAAYHGNAAMARLLLDAGAEVDARDERGATPLFFAARGCSEESKETAALLERAGAVVDLNIALCLGRGATVREWLQRDPEAIAKATFPDLLVFDFVLRLPDVWHPYGDPGLFSESTDLDLLEELFRRGAPIVAGTLTHAAQCCSTPIVELLLMKGADPNESNILRFVSEPTRELLLRFGAKEPESESL